MEKQKSNTCGIVGLCTGWLCPLAGLVLGIVSLGRKEPNKILGIMSIVEAVFFWFMWSAMFLAML